MRSRSALFISASSPAGPLDFFGASPARAPRTSGEQPARSSPDARPGPGPGGPVPRPRLRGSAPAEGAGGHCGGPPQGGQGRPDRKGAGALWAAAWGPETPARLARCGPADGSLRAGASSDPREPRGDSDQGFSGHWEEGLEGTPRRPRVSGRTPPGPSGRRGAGSWCPGCAGRRGQGPRHPRFAGGEAGGTGLLCTPERAVCIGLR